MVISLNKQCFIIFILFHLIFPSPPYPYLTPRLALEKYSHHACIVYVHTLCLYIWPLDRSPVYHSVNTSSTHVDKQTLSHIQFSEANSHITLNLLYFAKYLDLYVYSKHSSCPYLWRIPPLTELLLSRSAGRTVSYCYALHWIKHFTHVQEKLCRFLLLLLL